MTDNWIHSRVIAARAGTNPYVISKLETGWLVIGDVQPLPGYCVFLADPVVSSINELSNHERAKYSLDVYRAGDAILAATDAVRMNYETWGNSEPALHTHLMPRYEWENSDAAVKPACMSYSWKDARAFDPSKDEGFVTTVRAFLA